MQKLTRQSVKLPVSGYNHAGVHSLASASEAEPLNATFPFRELSLKRFVEGNSTRQDRPKSVRVPVVSKSGKALIPCKPSKARKLLKQGLAVKKWSKLGVFYIQLTFNPKSEYNKNQQIVLGFDVGSKFEGVALASKEATLLAGMLELPKGIAKKIEQRRRQRHLRRYRKCRRRQCRFDNRKRKDGWIAPSQKAKVDFKLKIIEELKKLYPITRVVLEDVRFNHYKKRWGKFFSTVEIGKTKVYETLSRWFNELKLITGVETASLRESYGVKKSSDKSERTLHSHAIDALVMCAGELEWKKIKSFSRFYVWKRCQYPRRQLHRFQFDKDGLRKRYGGSNSLGKLKKGDIVMWKGKLARVGGYMEGKGISLHTFDVDNKRFTQRANPDECVRLFNQKIMYSEFLPQLKQGVSFGGSL